MNDDVFKGQWKQLKGEMRQRWNKLTDDDLDVVDGEHGKARRPTAGAIRLGEGSARGMETRHLGRERARTSQHHP